MTSENIISKPSSHFHGWIILDKSINMSSNQALSKVKRLFQTKKAGHLGTLDPLATGVLPIALGEATKTIAYYNNPLKEYRFTVQWGHETDTDDAEGKIINASEKLPSAQEIEDILPQFQGEILQLPPRYSALKINGKRSYSLARAGKTFEIKPRSIKIHSLLIESHNPDSNQTTFCVECESGTYIRSIARDMGRMLGSYGYVSMLRRTKVGNFDEKKAITLEKLLDLKHNGCIGEEVLPIGVVLDDIPAIPISETDVLNLRQGRSIKASPSDKAYGALYDGENLVCIASFEESMWHPKRVFIYEERIKNDVD